jgi:16S rRNA (cytidine1402-2'-O)-methyltransferase
MTDRPAHTQPPAVIRCKGHPNVKAKHAKTLELTRDSDLTAAGTCIIGVEADYDEAALLKLRGPVRLDLACGDARDRVTARINPKFTVGAPLIVRRMPTPEPRAFCIGADKGSAALDRDLIAALTRPGAELTVTVTPLAEPAGAGDGLLTLVATPIGNLDDISVRAVAALESADHILCEDTRVSRELLALYGISTPTSAYHDHNERSRTEEILRRLQGGARIALISDAGMPLISDPGYALVRAAREAGVPVTAVPGPDAVTTALALSGLPPDDFRFIGFPPRKPTALRQRLDVLRDMPHTTVLFEAPPRIEKTLSVAGEVFGDRPMALCRNLTKFSETVLTGSAAEILDTIAAGAAVNGELVLVIEGAPPAEPTEQAGPPDAALDRLLEALVEAGLPTKALGDALARATGIKRRDGFERVLRLKGEKD